MERAIDVSVASAVAGFTAKCTLRNGIVEIVGQTPNGTSRTLGVLPSTVMPIGNYFPCTVTVPGTVDVSKNPTVIINPVNGQIELNVNGSLSYGIYFRAMWMIHPTE